MIISAIDQIAQNFVRVSPSLNEWILDVMQSQLAAGVYSSPVGGVFAKVMHYTCKNKSVIEMEAHKDFVDVQFLYSGVEGLAVARKPDNLSPLRADVAEDNYFYPVPDAVHAVHLAPRVAAVFFPSDLHAGGLMIQEPKEVSKVVLKIEVPLAQNIFSSFFHRSC